MTYASHIIANFYNPKKQSHIHSDMSSMGRSTSLAIVCCVLAASGEASLLLRGGAVPGDAVLWCVALLLLRGSELSRR